MGLRDLLNLSRVGVMTAPTRGMEASNTDTGAGLAEILATLGGGQIDPETEALLKALVAGEIGARSPAPPVEPNLGPATWGESLVQAAPQENPLQDWANRPYLDSMAPPAGPVDHFSNAIAQALQALMGR